MRCLGGATPAHHALGDSGPISTSFPGQAPSGVSLNNIAVDAAGNVRLDVVIA